MKKCIFLVLILLVALSLVACSLFEPIATIYGEIVHDAVKEFYEKYEICCLVRLEKDGKPTLRNFCIINDTQGGIDIMCISFARSDEKYDEYIATGSVLADNIELGKSYSTGDTLENTIVEYVICEKKDIPDSTLQKEKFTFGGQELYFCITSIVSPTE